MSTIHELVEDETAGGSGFSESCVRHWVREPLPPDTCGRWSADVRTG